MNRARYHINFSFPPGTLVYPCPIYPSASSVLEILPHGVGMVLKRYRGLTAVDVLWSTGRVYEFVPLASLLPVSTHNTGQYL